MVKSHKEKHYQVFISGIPYQLSQQQLRSELQLSEEALIKLPKYQDTGRCLGYAHIQFTNQQQFTSILAKNKIHIGGRYLTIQVAKGHKSIQISKPDVPIGCKVLFVKNLPYASTEEDIAELFGQCGIIQEIRMATNWVTKQFKGFAFIEYKNSGSVKKAIKKYSGYAYNGRNLIIDVVTTSQRKGFKKRMAN